MSGLSFFLAEILAALGLAWAIASYLRPHLEDVLDLVCGTPEATRFWLDFTRLMLLLLPLLSLTLFAHPRDIGFNELAEALRQGLVQILLGLLAALGAVGWNIWRFAKRATPAVRNQSETPTPDLQEP